MLVFPSIRVKGVDEMKKVSILLVLTVIIALFPACAEVYDYEFEFSYESDRSVYLVGETVKITAKMTNISGKTYRWTYGPFLATVRLYHQLDDGTLGEEIQRSPYLAIEYAPERHKAKNGESGETTVSFPIPEDAPIGKYTVVLWFDGEQKVFEDAITVLRPVDQNESDDVPYSSVTVYSGNEGVHPLSGLLYTNQYLNGEPALCGDGYGVYWFFDSIYDVTIEDYPYIVLDGEITVSASENVQIGTAYIYDLDFEKLDYNGGFEGLSALPAGEYLVVFTEYHDGSLKNPDAEEYWKTMYENLFRLIVRS